MNNALSTCMHVLIRRISTARTTVCEFNEGCSTSNGIDITETVGLTAT